MPRYVAFLRAINVGGHIVKMEALRKVFERMGFEDVDTFIASGNVIFRSAARNTAGLERKIERELENTLGFEVITFLRNTDEVAGVAEYAPFSPARIKAAYALNVGFLAAPVPAGARATLAALETDIDSFHVNGREFYWLCAQRQSDSKINNAVLERALKARATIRGIKTIQRLTARLAEDRSRR